MVTMVALVQQEKKISNNFSKAKSNVNNVYIMMVMRVTCM